MKRMIVIAVSLIAFSAEAQSVRRVRTLSIYDANGTKVGIVQDMNDELSAATFAVKLNGVVVTLQATTQYLTDPHQRALLFESADCSGQVLMDASPPVMIVPTFSVVNPLNTVYVASAGPPTLTTYNSRWDLQTGACVPGASTADVVPAQLIGSVGVFTPPYTVR